MLSRTTQSDIRHIANQCITGIDVEDVTGPIHVLNNIDESKLAVDNSYKLEVALKLKGIHTGMSNGSSLSRVLLSVIRDGFKFSKIEISALEKIFTILHTEVDTNTEGYNIAVNSVMLDSLVRAIDDQRAKQFNNITMDKVKLTDRYDSLHIKREYDALLVTGGIHVYINVLRLYASLMLNIWTRTKSNKF